MHSAPLRQQKGLSFIGLVLFGVIAVSVFAIGAQSLPILLEYQAVIKAAKKSASEGGSVAQVRANFDRAAQIDDITSITGKDLVITKNGDDVAVSFEYEREVPLVGPTYLVYRFNHQTQ